jgi:hypothetical protein
MIRDVVEVIAFLLAGAWAIYVFVYQNRIEPGFAQPALSMTMTMRHVGNDGPLAVIRIDETLRNTSPVRVHFLGDSVTVIGSRIVPLASPQAAAATTTQNQLQAYYSMIDSEPVFRYAFVTALGDPNTGKDLFLQPGEEVPNSYEFYVPRNKFARLEAYISVAFTKYDAKLIPTKMVIRKSGLVRFDSDKDAPPIIYYSAPLTELDLRGE